jgi:predicted ester cyclase
MNIEQVARNFVMNMGDEQKVTTQLTPDAMVDGGIMPRPMPAMEAIKIMEGLTKAMPDLTFDIQQVDVNGNMATVKARWSGTQTGPLNLGMPGLPSIPPTGKRVSVDDIYELTVKGDKVSHMTVESPSNGGIPGALSQLGVKLPNMPQM